MSISATEISELIKKKIEGLNLKAEARTEGTVVSLSDGIARIHGLSDVMQGEMIEFAGGVFGLALNLEQDSVGAVILGQYEHISEGDTVRCTGRILEVPVGQALLGRVVDSLGKPIDGKGDINTGMTQPIEKIAPVGQPAGADRLKIDRRDGAGRTWPA
jgi:F-type H+-transporting ATPase subunit alpha